MLTDPDKQAMGNREPANENISGEMYKEDPTQDVRERLKPFTVNLGDLDYICSHFPL